VKHIDYSDKAIELRIRQVAQLRKLCLSLAKADRKPSANAKKPSA